MGLVQIEKKATLSQNEVRFLRSLLKKDPFMGVTQEQEVRVIKMVNDGKEYVVIEVSGKDNIQILLEEPGVEKA